MEYFSELLQALIADKQMVRLLFVLLVVLSIGALCLGVAFLVLGIFDPVRKRMKYFLAGANIADEHISYETSTRLDSVSKYLLPSNEKEKNETKERLMHAGLYHLAQ